MTCDILIRNIKGLVQVRHGSQHILRGAAMAELPVISDAWLAISNGLIAGFGIMEAVPDISGKTEIDAKGKFVFPSFVDSHTHIVYAESREAEFVMKLKGMSYLDIAASGGGILNSAKKIQQLSENELYERTLPRIEEVVSTGTGAIEIKSGYGLTLKDEIKMLRVARRIGSQSMLTVKTTFLGAHAVPPEMDKSSYVRLVIDEMIPAIASEGLADYVDVFCERGFFSAADTEKILEAGMKFGMKGRVHANQLSRSGGVQAGVRAGAVSVDHLENIGEEEIDALTRAETIPTALPGAAFFLQLPFPPARKILDADLPLAIASDFNPGSAPSGNMQLAMSLACIGMRLTPEEAINAVTINTAAALEILGSHGSITEGKVANLFITKPMPSVAFMPYAFGTPMIDTVILKGKVCS